MLKIGKTKLTGAHKDEKASKTLEYFPEMGKEIMCSKSTPAN